MNILDRYIAKHVLYYILITFILFLGIITIIKFTEKIRFIDQDYTLLVCMLTILLDNIHDLILLFPAILLIGVLLGLGRLSNTSELAIIQVAGYSKLKVSFTVVKTVLPLILICALINVYIVPSLVRLSYKLEDYGLQNVPINISNSGVWTRDNNSFIYVQNFLQGNETRLDNVRIFNFDDQQNLINIQYAQKAVYENNEWHLEQVENTDISSEQIKYQTLPSKIWQTTITPAKLSIAAIKPNTMEFKELIEYSQFLKNSGQNYKIIEIEIWNKLTYVFVSIIMILLGVSFIFGMLRNTSAGLRILIGICCGFGFYIFNEGLTRFSLIWDVPVWVTSIVPSLVFFYGAVYILRKHKRG